MKTRVSLWIAAAAVCGLILVQGGCSGRREYREPFNGRDLTGWKFAGKAEDNKWIAGIAAMDPQDSKKLVLKPGKGELINLVGHHNESGDLYTAEVFGDCRIELDVMVPENSNSGIYVGGEYEIQVLDSYGKTNPQPETGDMGAVYGQAAPQVLASRAPGEWLKYVIEFQAARFDGAGKKTQDARLLRVVLNGQILHENLAISITPGGLTGVEKATGPLMFQGNHGPVAFRNIRIMPLALR